MDCVHGTFKWPSIREKCLLPLFGEASAQRPHKCEVLGCGKAYFNTSHLRRHITTTHSPASLYKKLLKCPHPGCLTELSNPQNLKRHIYRKHQRVYPFQCEFCDKGFTRQSQLQSHLYQHTGILPITCSYCQLRFRTQRDLKRHERSHSNIYACDFPNCEEMFQRRVHLLKHITVHHPSEFICDVCKKSFKTKCRLLVHMAVHQDTTQREVIRCPYINCSRFYYHKRNLTFHIQARHKGKKKKTKEVFCTIWPKKETKDCLSHDEYLSTQSSPSSLRTAAVELGLKPEIFIALQGESMQKGSNHHVSGN
ncbi:uncharacterized protein [Periplaneta americana]|uniref:uncharacterized protein isoform X3 n=1 Tax=Periplaneta americana TaxID=6978 RepID=UPI0037E9B458